MTYYQLADAVARNDVALALGCLYRHRPLASLIRGIITVAASILNPFFGVLVGSFFDLIGRNRHVNSVGSGKLTTRYFRWWSFAVWQTRPVSVAQNLDTAFLASVTPSPGAGAIDLSGPMEYKLRAEARTGAVMFLGGLSGMSVAPTGDISHEPVFSIDWQ